MRVVTQSGEALDVMGRVRLSDDQVRRTRALQMLAMRDAGRSAREIAVYFRVTECHVRREIRSIPGWMREKVDALLV